jgi:hypothetical protein
MVRVILAVTRDALRGQCRLGDVLGDVASFAIEVAMGSGQGIARLNVVIEAPAFPAVRVVAKRAARSEAAFMVAVAMTGLASQRCALEPQRAMAFFAGHDGMMSDQRKAGDVVIKRGPAPAFIAVTLLAAGTELTLVPVILFMARHAGRLQFVMIKIARVAAIAFNVHMCAPQQIARPVVIEVSRFPSPGLMTCFASGAVPPAVNVLDLVAVYAFEANVLVAFADMAGRAGDRLVRAQEWKSGRVVVEGLDLAPRFFAMASIAFLAKAPLMRVN